MQRSVGLRTELGKAPFSRFSSSVVPSKVESEDSDADDGLEVEDVVHRAEVAEDLVYD